MKTIAIILALIIASSTVSALSVYYLFQPTTPSEKRLKIAFTFTSPISEPFVARHYEAYQQAKEELNVDAAWSDSVASGDMERICRQYAEQGYDIVWADGSVFEVSLRSLVNDYPNVTFMAYTGKGPQAPNLGSYITELREPGYLMGMIAGLMTKTNVVSVVGAYPIPSINRYTWTYYMGAHEVNPNVSVKVSYIEAWYDPVKAKEMALAQIDAGSDVVYATRYGAIEAAVQRGVYAIGHGDDQHSLGNDTVITSTLYDVYPLVKEVIRLVRANAWEPRDFTAMFEMKNGGSDIAPYYNFETILPASVKAIIADRRQAIINGTYVVELRVSAPPSD